MSSLIYSFILMVPFDSQDLKGVVYVWIGSKAEHEEATLAEKIAYMMYAVSITLNIY
jgi:hypothetical protein